MKRKRTRYSVSAAIALSVISLTALLPLQADSYQYIIKESPYANTSYPAVSSAKPLETSARTARSMVSSLEARFRTWKESLAKALRSDKAIGLTIIFR